MIVILTGPVQSGKTTDLVNWSKTTDSVGGVLTPDVDGKRMVYFPESNSFRPFEIGKKLPPADLVEVGKFRFLKTAFDEAREAIRAARGRFRFVVIDEVGKLELRDQGLEPAVRESIELYRNRTEDRHLILVVRDYLLEQVIEKYGLDALRLQIIRTTGNMIV